MSPTLKELQEMIDKRKPVFYMINLIEKSDKKNHPLEYIFLLAHITESLLREVLHNSQTIGNNIMPYFEKYREHPFNPDTIRKVNRIRNNMTHGGLIYNPTETTFMINTYISYINTIARDRGIDLKQFKSPPRKEINVDEEELCHEQPKMKKRTLASFFVIFVLLVSILGYFTFFSTEKIAKTVMLAASKGGTYSKISSDISTNIIKEVQVKATKGSFDNMNYIYRNPEERIFALVQGDVLQYLAEKASYENQKERKILKKLRVLFPMFKEEVHVLVHKENDEIKNFSDLKNKKISIGSQLSGRAITAESLYKKLFKEEIKYKEPFQEFPEELRSLIKGSIDAIILVGGQPLDSLQSIEMNKLKFIPYNNFNIEKVNKNYSKCSLTRESYSWMRKEEIPTLCVQAFLVTNIIKKSSYIKKVIEKFDEYKEELRDLNEKAKRRKSLHFKWKNFISSDCLPTFNDRHIKYHRLTEWRKECLSSLENKRP